VKEIRKFVADDGTEFTSEVACLGHESLCNEIASIVSRLNPGTEKHGEFVQQSGPVALGVQRDLVLIFERLHPKMVDHHTEWAREATRPAGMTLIGRYMDDCGPSPLYAAWHRIMRMDHQFREWDQPYFAIQADKAVAA